MSIPERVAQLDHLTLLKGAHQADDYGVSMCVMEAVAYVAGSPMTDAPECASVVIAAFCRSWNDSLDVEDRNRLLKPLVPLLVGTAASAQVENARAWMCLDWLVRIYTPAWLRAAKLDEQAARLEGLPEFRTGLDVPSVKPAIEAVRSDAFAAWAAAWTAAWDAAWDAAWAAAGDAAWTAAGDAARDAAWAARDAAWAAARDAARAAAADALAPTVTELQTSAVALIHRMIDAGSGGAA